MRAARANALRLPGNRAISAPVAGNLLTVLVVFATVTVFGQAVALAALAAELVEADAKVAAPDPAAPDAEALTHFLSVETVTILLPPVATAAAALELELELELELDEPVDPDEWLPDELAAPALELAPAPAEADTPPTEAEVAAELEEDDELELELEATITLGVAIIATSATRERIKYFIILLPINLHLLLKPIRPLVQEGTGEALPIWQNFPGSATYSVARTGRGRSITSSNDS
ncbi:MAG: hypothetical protein UX60_C0020G0002 [Berkelbacteria bacterium GW2011_GWA2_46_7]|uniref:Uncharacterized protein n=1 Tax=Berkelbacteria bacterium GW2011_GWA2_46_7 TaxID=1618335 RepID=A0A0G1QFA5_9BACT|nr:MAG: hypothetical protein UX60_C0020G0002 [Berkelbacteria bacterium GW2011_GWA2_46_7]